MRAAAAAILAGGERDGFSSPFAVHLRVIDHVPAKDDDVSRLNPLFRTAADEGAQLLLGPVNHGGGFRNDLTAKFELAEEIELLAGGIERKPVAVSDRQGRRL